MLQLEDGMLLYHGSYQEVSQIDLERCVIGKDFGRGFYLTSSREQAHRFVSAAIKKHRLERGLVGKVDFSAGRVSVFRYHATSDASTFVFPSANVDWLHFVAANRSFRMFRELIDKYECYDIVAGKIANDKTSRTISAYLDGLYGGEPGSEIADRLALELLLPNRLEDQYCFRTPRAVSSLEFLRSEVYDPTI